VVWAWGRVGITECPRSYITAESAAWLEQYAAWRVARRAEPDMPARDLDAMLTLDREFAAEAARTGEGDSGQK